MQCTMTFASSVFGLLYVHWTDNVLHLLVIQTDKWQLVVWCAIEILWCAKCHFWWKSPYSNSASTINNASSLCINCWPEALSWQKMSLASKFFFFFFFHVWKMSKMTFRPASSQTLMHWLCIIGFCPPVISVFKITIRYPLVLRTTVKSLI